MTLTLELRETIRETLIEDLNEGLHCGGTFDGVAFALECDHDVKDGATLAAAEALVERLMNLAIDAIARDNLEECL